MFKIGILGSDNSHAMNFCRICNLPDENGKYRYEDVRIVAIHGHNDDPEHTKQVAKEGNIPHIVNSGSEMLGMVDAVMAVHRDGKYHLAETRPFLEKGIPVWIDKPICTTMEDAVQLKSLVTQFGPLLSGGSSLKYCLAVNDAKNAIYSGSLGTVCGGSISYPGDRSNPYSGLFFYGPHLCMVLTEVFGYDVESILAVSSGPHKTVCVARYPDGRLVSLQFFANCWQSVVTVNGEKDVFSAKITLDGVFTAEMDAFVELLRTGNNIEDFNDMLTGSYLLLAIEKSITEGREVQIERL